MISLAGTMAQAQSTAPPNLVSRPHATRYANVAEQTASPVAAASRIESTDLAITGLGRDTQYLTRAQLLALPQTTALLTDDENFDPGTHVTVRGVTLEALAHALHAPASLNLIELRCTDGYRGHLTAGFIAQHHPILALTIEGQLPEKWAAAHKTYDPGPYFVTYAEFHPAFRVLAHNDYAQVPANMDQIDFNSSRAFAPLAPHLRSQAVEDGFIVAKQNCLRCHSAGHIGGTKSRFSWGDLAQMARANPQGFAAYILKPKSLNPSATMPANPGYDQPTLAALTAYFAALSPTPAKDAR
jgi:mono/diheme cytochrome c family protein